jgi:hypothetical protein
MSEWTSTFDAVFFISIATLLVGALGTAMKYCLKSKCEQFNCCYGLFEIKRRVDLEVEEELKELNSRNQNRSNDNFNQNNPLNI